MSIFTNSASQILLIWTILTLVVYFHYLRKEKFKPLEKENNYALLELVLNSKKLENNAFVPSMVKLPPLDYEQLINKVNFNFLKLHKVCEKDVPFLLILVHSAPCYNQRRELIRETWGSFNSSVFKVIFLIGVTAEKKIQKKLDEEDQRFQDLVQGNVRDAYRYLTYKHIMAFKYALYHCPKAKYFLKVDDDTFVNIPLLINYLQVLNPNGLQNLLLCIPANTLNVVRSRRSKYRLSFREYKYSKFPPYCAGFFILYSIDVIFNLYKEAQRTKDYFWVDDVYVTGTLMKNLNKSSIFLKKNIVIFQKELNLMMEKSKCVYFLVLQPHILYSSKEYKSLWNFVKNCTITEFISNIDNNIDNNVIIVPK